MNKYELTLVLPEKFTPAKVKAQKESLEKIVKILKGSITDIKDWGLTPLSYKIKGNSAGIFILYELELESDSVSKLKDKLKTEESIIRYLLIRN
ncbi:MAG TPA: 30S ribosomal protein S6 [Patescibacteria group bacterium]|nr:30S ribosomal protein S6 [Patescibacteria group bacterium]